MIYPSFLPTAIHCSQPFQTSVMLDHHIRILMVFFLIFSALSSIVYNGIALFKCDTFARYIDVYEYILTTKSEPHSLILEILYFSSSVIFRIIVVGVPQRIVINIVGISFGVVFKRRSHAKHMRLQLLTDNIWYHGNVNLFEKWYLSINIVRRAPNIIWQDEKNW